MLTDIQLKPYFEDQLDLTAIFHGLAELEPFPGQPDSFWLPLYQVIEAGIHISRDRYEAAVCLLDQLERTGQDLFCLRLASLWLLAEQDDPGQVWKDLTNLIGSIDSEGDQGSLMDSLDPLESADLLLARRWAPVLRLYILSLLPELDSVHMAAAAEDEKRIRSSGLPEPVITRLDFYLRLEHARQQRSVTAVVELAREWQSICLKWPFCGTGLEYYQEAILALEYDDRFDEALTWIDEGLGLGVDQADCLVIKARIMKRQGRVEESLEICNQLVDLMPNDYAGYCLRSNAWFLLGDYDQAMQDAIESCRIAPDNANALMARAYVLMQAGEYEEALRDFNRSLEHDPERYDALRGQGKCLSMLNQDYAALACFEAMRKVYPDDPDIYYELADVLFAAGYLDDCERACRRCLLFDPEYVSAMVILGMIAMRRNQDELARKLLNQAVEIDPQHPFALNELAYMIHLDGDDDLALELVNRALEESPDYTDALCNKGVMLYFRSDFDQALTIFDQILDFQDDHVGALVGKGNTLTQLCDFDLAQACFDQALQIEPDNADACHGKAVLYRMMGLDNEVREWQERAWRLEKEDEPD